MMAVRQCPVPESSLLAGYGGADDYRDCFLRDLPGDVSLTDFIYRFYRSRAFLPERWALKALGKPASSADARALADRKSDHFGVWKVFERQADQILLESKPTGTASWFAVEKMDGEDQSSSSQAVGQQTRLYFGSWVGSIGESGWNALLKPHLWYSRELLGAL